MSEITPEGEVDDAAKPVALWWAQVLTCVWGVCVLLILIFGKGCADNVSRWNVVSRQLLCRDLNAVGDFLAGACAPLAFIWLVATVFIQAQELRLQRHELRLTRTEFELNRKVTEKSAGFIGIQTEVMKEELKETKAQARARRLNPLLTRLHTLLRGEFINQLLLLTGGGFGEPLIDDKSFSEITNREQAISRMAQRAVEIVEKWKPRVTRGEAHLNTVKVNALLSLSWAVEETLSITEEDRQDNLALVANLHLQELATAVRYLLAVMPKS
jgi:hypothetical protein